MITLTLCCSTQNCPLQEDSVRLVQELQRAGVAVDHRHDPACVDGFWRLPFVWNNEAFWPWLKDAILS